MEAEENQRVNDIMRSIRRIVRSINLESKRIQKEFGVSIPQLLSLKYLFDSKDFQCTHKELVKHLNLNSSTVTGIVNRLEKKGLIARLPKKGDRRVTYIALTSAGDELMTESPGLIRDTLTSKLLEQDPEKLEPIAESLNKLVEILEIEEVDASPLLIIDDPLDSPK